MKSKVDSKNGRVVTSVQISLAKPTNQRAGNKIQLTQTPPSKKMITYTREFLLSLRSTNSKAPKMMNIDSKLLNSSVFDNFGRKYNEFLKLKVYGPSIQCIWSLLTEAPIGGYHIRLYHLVIG